MVQTDLAEQLCPLQLRLQNSRLVSLSYFVTLSGIGHQLLQDSFALLQQPQRLLQVCKLEIVELDLLDDRTAQQIGLLLLGVRLALGNFAAQPQLAGKGQVLRRAKADVGKIAVAESSKRLRTADAECLNAEVR